MFRPRSKKQRTMYQVKRPSDNSMTLKSIQKVRVAHSNQHMESRTTNHPSITVNTMLTMPLAMEALSPEQYTLMKRPLSQLQKPMFSRIRVNVGQRNGIKHTKLTESLQGNGTANW